MFDGSTRRLFKRFSIGHKSILFVFFFVFGVPYITARTFLPNICVPFVAISSFGENFMYNVTPQVAHFRRRSVNELQIRVMSIFTRSIDDRLNRCAEIDFFSRFSEFRSSIVDHVMIEIDFFPLKIEFFFRIELNLGSLDWHSTIIWILNLTGDVDSGWWVF